MPPPSAIRVPCSVSSSAARSASVKTLASRHAATRLSRTDVSPAAAASLVCMSRQNPQPLIWLARIFTSSWVVSGRGPAEALPAATRCLTAFIAGPLSKMSSRASMMFSFVVWALTHSTTQHRGMSGETRTSRFGRLFRRTRIDEGKAGGRHMSDDPGLSAVVNERRQLLNLTYRLLGSLADAEDVVQETYTRWYAMTAQQQQAIESPGGWLTTVASRICLDLLGSARARRERYVGEWIPEPVPASREWIGGRTGDDADPADRVTLDESISMAFLVVLESMTPAERVAFILHDVFRYPFAEVAEVVGRTPAACRQLASSARRRIRRGIVDADHPAGGHRQGLQAGVGSQGHPRARRPPRPRGHGDRRQRRACQGPPAADRGRRADRPRLRRLRRPRARADAVGAHGQRPARSRGSGGRRHRDGVRLRRRRRADHPHLGHAQPREAADLGRHSAKLKPRNKSASD